MTEKKINAIQLKRLAKYIGNIITVLSIIFIISSICHMEISINSLPNKKMIILFSFLGIVITVCCLILLGYAWMQPLQCFGTQKINFGEVIVIYLKANIGKYLPGNVVHYVERNLFAANMGVRQIYIAISSLMEIVIIIVTALGMSLLFSYKDLILVIQNFISTKWLVVITGVVFSLLIFFFLLFFRVPKIRNIIMEIKNLISMKKGIIVLFKMTICDIIMLCGNGICFALICQSIPETTMSAKTIIYLMNCYILAWVAGYCIPGAPGGIGVREMIIMLLAGNAVSSDTVVLAAVIHRTVTIFGDFFGYCISMMGNKYLKAKKLII